MDSLLSTLAGVLDDFCLKYPGTTEDDIFEVLDQLKEIARNTRREGGETE